MLVIGDEGSANPFPTDLRADSWVAYHGTSDAYAEEIETNGLGHGELPEWFDDTVRLAQLFQELQYAGLPGGVSTFPFAVNDTERKSGQKLIYLAEDFERACTFALFPGGESINAIRVALDDLRELATISEMQRMHHDHLVRLATQFGGIDDTTARDRHLREAAARSWADQSLPASVHHALSLLEDPRALEERVRAFDDLWSLAEGIQRRHAPVVYAVRLTATDLLGGSYSSAAGIALVTVPRERLIAKCRLEFERDAVRFLDADGLKTTMRWQRRFEAGADYPTLGVRAAPAI